MSGIAESNWRGRGLEQAERNYDGSFGDVRRLDWNLVEGCFDVNLGKDLAALEVNREVMQVRDVVAVRDNYFVKSPLVALGPELTRVTLGLQMDGRGRARL